LEEKVVLYYVPIGPGFSLPEKPALPLFQFPLMALNSMRADLLVTTSATWSVKDGNWFSAHGGIVLPAVSPGSNE